jgi:hypothetical protein
VSDLRPAASSRCVSASICLSWTVCSLWRGRARGGGGGMLDRRRAAAAAVRGDDEENPHAPRMCALGAIATAEPRLCCKRKRLCF